MENNKITVKDHVAVLVRTVKFSCAMAEIEYPDCKQVILDALIGELEEMAGRKKVNKESCGEPQNLNFGNAIRLVKEGFRLARKGWNGKGQYVELASCISYISTTGEAVNVDHRDIGNKALAFVGTSGVQLGWLASQADMLAEDWYVVK